MKGLIQAHRETPITSEVVAVMVCVYECIFNLTYGKLILLCDTFSFCSTSLLFQSYSRSGLVHSGEPLRLTGEQVFMQAGFPSCHSTDSIKALKGTRSTDISHRKSSTEPHPFLIRQPTSEHAALTSDTSTKLTCGKTEAHRHYTNSLTSPDKISYH